MAHSRPAQSNPTEETKKRLSAAATARPHDPQDVRQAEIVLNTKKKRRIYVSVTVLAIVIAAAVVFYQAIQLQN